ncbi:hypothetical protein [Haladaptatus sp. NG-SE-30]
MLEDTQERAKQRAQSHIDEAKDELGRQMFDAFEEHFPEQTKAQQREDRLQMFVVGVAVGILAHYLFNR